MTGESPGTPTETGQWNADANQLPAAWDMLFADLEQRRPALFVDAAAAGWDGYDKFPLARYPRLRAYVDATLPPGRGRAPASSCTGGCGRAETADNGRHDGHRDDVGQVIASARTRRRRRGARRTSPAPSAAPASNVPKFPGTAGMAIAALMPTSVSSAVAEAGPEAEGALEQHQHDDLGRPAEQRQRRHRRHPARRRRLQSRRQRALHARPPAEARDERAARGEHARRRPATPSADSASASGPRLRHQRAREDEQRERERLGAALRPRCWHSRRRAALPAAAGAPRGPGRRCRTRSPRWPAGLRSSPPAPGGTAADRISATRQRAAFSGRYTAKLSRIDRRDRPRRARRERAPSTASRATGRPPAARAAGNAGPSSSAPVDHPVTPDPASGR